MKKKILLFSFASALVVLLAIASTSCVHYGRVFLSGVIVTEEIPIQNINDVSIHSAITLYLQQGEEESMRIEIDENLRPYFLMRRDRNSIDFRFRNGISFSGRGVSIYMTYKDLREVDASGASQIIFTDTVSYVKDLKIEASGASKVEAEVLYAEQRIRIELTGASRCYGTIDAERAEYDLAGSSHFEGGSFSREGKIELTGASRWDGYGECKDLEVDAAGASTVSDYEMEIERLNVDLSGASKMYCRILSRAYVEASGASDFYYKGDPSVLRDVVLSGGSKIHNR